MADFPTVVPTSRSFQPGDWPIKRFTSQNGSEVRILRGNSRLNSQLDLTYDNIPDTEAEKFLTHYREVQGTFKTWYFPPAPSDGIFVAAFKGWGGSSVTELETSPWGMAWRYAEPPQVTQVKRGISNVRLRLTGVLRESTAITSAASVAPTPPAPASVPRFTSFYGAEWAGSDGVKDVRWSDSFVRYAARKTIGVPGYTFEDGKNTSPGLEWKIAGFASAPQTFEIICVDTTRAGTSRINKKAPTLTKDLSKYENRYLHWRISGPASSVVLSALDNTYRIMSQSDASPSALPASWSASALESDYGSKASSTTGWLGPYKAAADEPEHQYWFVITALDAGGNALANEVASSFGVWKFGS